MLFCPIFHQDTTTHNKTNKVKYNIIKIQISANGFIYELTLLIIKYIHVEVRGGEAISG